MYPMRLCPEGDVHGLKGEETRLTHELKTERADAVVKAKYIVVGSNGRWLNPGLHS